MTNSSRPFLYWGFIRSGRTSIFPIERVDGRLVCGKPTATFQTSRAAEIECGRRNIAIATSRSDAARS